VRGHLPPTPQWSYPALNQLVGAEVLVKHENTQPIGVFKVRGGLVLLAGLPDDELQARLQGHPLQRFTAHTTTDMEALLAHIRQARQQGWCLVNQELEEGLISIAAPLTNRTGQTVAALNISGQANRTSAAMMQESLLPALLSAARTISRMMGAPRG